MSFLLFVIIGAFAVASIVGANATGLDVGAQLNLGDWWTKYDLSYQRIGLVYGVNWQWLKTFALNESNNGTNPLVVAGALSSDGLSKGLMQITLSTALLYDPTATLEKLAQLDPADYSIDLAAQIIADNKNEFDQNDPRYLELVVKRYNGSAKAVKNQANGIPNGLNRNGDDIDALLNAYWDRWQRNFGKVQQNA